MIKPELLDDVARKISQVVPEGMQELKSDIDRQVRLSVQNAFQRMDLVTREEFDVQGNVLRRTREKLEALEKRVDALEAELDKDRG